jgi:hypothetical protein
VLFGTEFFDFGVKMTNTQQNNKFPRIEARVWCPQNPNFEYWEIVNRQEGVRITLSSELSEIEIGSIVQKICGQLKFDPRFQSPKAENDSFWLRTFKKIPQFKHFYAQNSVAGILTTKLEDFAQIEFLGKNGAKTNNGCCSDFRYWKNLKNVKNGTFWFGHDPSPFFEYVHKTETLLIWTDKYNKGSKDKQHLITFTWSEYEENLERLEKDLNDFIFLLNVWMKKNFPKLVNDFVTKIKENLGV